MNAIRNDWNDYRLKVVPLDAPDLQVIECRRAYFAGAGMVVRLLQALAAQSPTLPAVERELDGLRREVEQFRAEVRADRA